VVYIDDSVHLANVQVARPLGFKIGWSKFYKRLQSDKFVENVVRSTLSYPNETSKECIQT
jgi:hypothetical protein